MKSQKTTKFVNCILDVQILISTKNKSLNTAFFPAQEVAPYLPALKEAQRTGSQPVKRTKARGAAVLRVLIRAPQAVSVLPVASGTATGRACSKAGPGNDCAIVVLSGGQEAERPLLLQGSQQCRLRTVT